MLVFGKHEAVVVVPLPTELTYLVVESIPGQGPMHEPIRVKLPPYIVILFALVGIFEHSLPEVALFFFDFSFKDRSTYLKVVGPVFLQVQRSLHLNGRAKLALIIREEIAPTLKLDKSMDPTHRNIVNSQVSIHTAPDLGESPTPLLLANRGKVYHMERFHLPRILILLALIYRPRL